MKFVLRTFCPCLTLCKVRHERLAFSTNNDASAAETMQNNQVMTHQASIVPIVYD